MRVVDINCGLGEGFPDDEQLFPLISSANIACGFHAGEEATMRRASALAREHGVSIGAHPSYRDRAGFGRNPVEIAPGDLIEQLTEQITALRAAAAQEGTTVRYLKPHGALYNRIAHDPEQADAVALAAASAGLPVLGLAGSAIEEASARHQVRFFSEAFADRGYRADGTLVPRTEPNSVLSDPSSVADRVAVLLETDQLSAVTGEPLWIHPDSLCVHGDSPDALALLRAVRARVPDTRPFA